MKLINEVVLIVYNTLRIFHFGRKVHVVEKIPREVCIRIRRSHRNRQEGDIYAMSTCPTTQIYLGKVPDTEAMRWIENLYT